MFTTTDFWNQQTLDPRIGSCEQTLTAGFSEQLDFFRKNCAIKIPLVVLCIRGTKSGGATPRSVHESFVL